MRRLVLAAFLTALAAPSALCAAPGAADFSGVASASLQANWTDGGNPPGTTYVAQLSTDSFATVNVASQTLNTLAVFSGLGVNTTYYARVQELSSAFTSLGSTSTLAAAPSAADPSGVASNQITANWTGGGNPSGTLYQAEISVNSGFSSLVASSATRNNSATFTGLVANTLYYTRVRAVSHAGAATGFTSLGSTATLVSSPGLGFSDVADTQVRTNWTSGGNPSGTSYQAVLSTGASPGSNGFSGNRSSTTLNLFAVFSSLTPNTSYFAEVQAVGIGGGGSGFTSLGSTITLAQVPGAAGPSGVSADLFTANWTAGANPAGTFFLAQISTSPGFATISGSSSTLSASVLFSGLSANTTYYTRVRAANSAGTPTDFTVLSATVTLPNAPGLAAFTPVAETQIRANWTAEGNAAGTIYAAVLSSGASPDTNGFSGNQSSSTLNAFASFPGLSPNTTYYAAVKAVGFGGRSSAYSSLGSTPTLANAPIAGALSAVTTTQITASWTANSNPAGTLYRLQAGTDSGFSAIAASSTTQSLSAALTGLSADTTYFVRVAAINHSGLLTGYASLSSTMTLPNSPAAPALSASAAVSSLTWTWNAVASAAGYRVVTSTGGNLSGSLPSSATAYAELGLSTNTAHARAVVAFNAVGLSTSALVTAYTLAAPPTSSSLTVVGASSMTLSWSANTNPAGTSFVARIWEDPLSKTTQAVTATSTSFENLVPGTSYFADVYAVNGDSVATSATVEISTFLAYRPSASATIGASGGTLLLNTPHGPISAVFPTGAFAVPVSATLSLPSSFPSAVSNAASLSAVGLGVQIDLSPGLQPLKTISLSLGYLPADIAGHSAERLILARYDTIRAAWVPLVSASLTGSRRVSGQTNHLSLFQLMAAAPAAGLAGAKVYPNPLRPSQGHTGVTFSQLPAETRIRLYTIAGELVDELMTGATGSAQWDGNNRSGQRAASGVYFAVVQGAGDKTVLKVTVQR